MSRTTDYKFPHDRQIRWRHEEGFLLMFMMANQASHITPIKKSQIKCARDVIAQINKMIDNADI